MDIDDILPRGKRVAQGIPNMDDVETARMSLSSRDDTDSPQVMASSNHTEVSRFKFNEV